MHDRPAGKTPADGSPEDDGDGFCGETGCSSIYCHHHSKGAQGAKKAMDRASGSGGFARDPDAQMDMIQLEVTEEMRSSVGEGRATAWRLFQLSERGDGRANYLSCAEVHGDNHHQGNPYERSQCKKQPPLVQEVTVVLRSFDC